MEKQHTFFLTLPLRVPTSEMGNLNVFALISLNYWPKVVQSLRSTDLIFFKTLFQKGHIADISIKLNITHLFGTLRTSLIKTEPYDAQVFAVEDELCWGELQLLVWTQYFLLSLCIIYWEEQTQSMTKNLPFLQITTFRDDWIDYKAFLLDADINVNFTQLIPLPRPNYLFTNNFVSYFKDEKVSHFKVCLKDLGYVENNTFSFKTWYLILALGSHAILKRLYFYKSLNEDVDFSSSVQTGQKTGCVKQSLSLHHCFNTTNVAFSICPCSVSYRQQWDE